MCAEWNKKKYDPEIIIRALNSKRMPSDGQSVSWRGAWISEIEELEEILLSAVNLSDDLNEAEQLGVVRASVQDIAKSQPLNSELLIKALKQNEAVLLQKPDEPHILVSSWSVRIPRTMRKLPLGFVTVNAHVTGKIRSERNEGIDKAKSNFACELPSDYEEVKVRVRARDAHSAYRRGQDTLDLLRGVWNWHLNRRIDMRLSWGPRVPVNPIQPGPIHTVHALNGDHAAQTWYDPSFVGPLHTKSLAAGDTLNKLRRFEFELRRALRRSRYRAWIEKAIQRYAQAFDAIDFEIAFLRAWSLLEYLTASEGRYDDLVRRASCVWKDYDFHRQVLAHLRDHRNNVAHQAVESSKRGTHLFQVKRYVETLMHFHVQWGQRLEKDEALELLSGPRDLQKIRRRQKLLKISAQMRIT